MVSDGEQMKLHPLRKENCVAILQQIKIHTSIFIPKHHTLISISEIQGRLACYYYSWSCSKTQQEITFVKPHVCDLMTEV